MADEGHKGGGHEPLPRKLQTGNIFILKRFAKICTRPLWSSLNFCQNVFGLEIVHVSFLYRKRIPPLPPPPLPAWKSLICQRLLVVYKILARMAFDHTKLMFSYLWKFFLSKSHFHHCLWRQNMKEDPYRGKRIGVFLKTELEMQSCHNDVRAMTPCFYVSNKGATLGLSRAICKKSVASVIVEIVRAKERSPKRPETEKMVPGRSRMRVSGERRI